MPKRGQKLPYKYTFQYPTQDKSSTRAVGSKGQALREGRAIARRGAWVEVFHIDPATQERADIARYDENSPAPENDDDIGYMI